MTAGTHGSRQVGLEIDIEGSRDVSLPIGLPAPLWFSQVPPDVRQPQHGMIEMASQPVGGNQRAGQSGGTGSVN